MSEPLVIRHLVRGNQLVDVLLYLPVRGLFVVVPHGFLLGLLILFGAMVSQARAADLTPTSWWINTGAVSWHAEPGFNGTNPGLGIDARWSDTWGLSAGVLRNSQSRWSRYLVAGYTPWHPTLPLIGQTHVGVAAGTVDGYRLRDGKPIPLLAPLMERRWKHVGISAMYVPEVKNTSSQALVVFIKWSF